jgi:hypothetical protein
VAQAVDHLLCKLKSHQKKKIRKWLHFGVLFKCFTPSKVIFWKLGVYRKFRE